MGNGSYTRPACPGCGAKTMTPGSIMVADALMLPASVCRTCRCTFSGGLIVRGPSRVVTEEMRNNRAFRLRQNADYLDARAAALKSEATECRAAADRMVAS